MTATAPPATDAAPATAPNDRPALWLGVVVVAVIALYLVPSSRFAIVPLAAVGIVGLRRPALVLAVIPATFPFYDAVSPGAGLRLDRTGLLVVVAAVAAAGHLLLAALPALVPALARPARILAGEARSRDEARALPGDVLTLFRGLGRGAACGIYAAVALLALGALSLLTVADPAHRGDSIRQFRVVIVFPVLFFLAFAATLTLVPPRRRDPWASLQLATDALVVGGVIVALVGVAQFLGVNAPGIVGVEGVRRVRSVFGHPNEVALLLGRIIPFTAAFVVFAPRRPRNLRRWLYIAATLVMLLGVGLSFSRGGYIGVAAALFVVLVATGRRRWLMAFAVTVAVAVVAGLASGTERFTSLLQPDSGSEGLRLNIWHSTAAMLRDHPVWGVGLDQFLTQYAPRYIDPAAWPERFTAHPHNLLLDFYVRLGVLGLAWLVFTLPPLVALGGRAARDLRAAGEPMQFALALGATASLVDMAVHGFVDQAYFLHMLAYTFWFAALIIHMAVRWASATNDAGAAVREQQAVAAPVAADTALRT